MDRDRRQLIRIGVDTSKRFFQVHGVDQHPLAWKLMVSGEACNAALARPAT